MDTNFVPIETVQSTLARVRQNSATKKKFPQGLWHDIIQLTKIYPMEEVCHQLQIHPSLLKRKMDLTKQNLEFHEIVCAPPPQSDVIHIELTSSSGLKANIQGPVSCLDRLYKLFER